jgi:hypothetical protein
MFNCTKNSMHDRLIDVVGQAEVVFVYLKTQRFGD